jgi:hypothetical protein
VQHAVAHALKITGPLSNEVQVLMTARSLLDSPSGTAQHSRVAPPAVPFPAGMMPVQNHLDTVLRYLDGAEGWAASLSQVGVDWLSHVRRHYCTRAGAIANDLILQVVLSTHPSHVSYAQGVRRLRRLCRETGLVPASCKVPLAVLTDSATPFSQTAFSDVWSATLEGRRVAVKALRLHGDQVYDVRRVSAGNSFV